MKNLFLTGLIACSCLHAQAKEATILLDLNSTAGGTYEGTSWNGLSTSIGTGSAPHNGIFNQTDGDRTGKLYSSLGVEIEDVLFWKAVNSYATGSGLWATNGIAGTTPQTYCPLPAEVTDSSFSFNNGALFTFTLGGLTAGNTYTLTFGGNAMGTTGTSASVLYTFNNMAAGSLQGEGGTASGNIFTIANPATTAYALSVRLTASETGEISFTGTRTGTASSAIAMSYMSLTGDFSLVPEPATAIMSLAGFGMLGWRRRRP